MVDPISNEVLEQIHQVLGNLVGTFNIPQTYIDENDPQTGILSASAFEILSTTNKLKGYSYIQLVFGRDMILPIKHKMDYVLIHQKNQVQINKYDIRKNRHIVDYDYTVGYNIMLNNHTEYKYETPYKVKFVLTQCFTNGTVSLQCGAIQMKYNIRRINPYKLDTKVGYYGSKNMYDNVNI